ncbi:hypothetical protein CWI42_020710 [Ordospora colligata]|uniref:Uncharacterized protein n=1 Tax=Ordospora colligata OC4 TaxID=1354746 RepID=A0A0B2UGS5_9MICR|nr:uncharacterized protein M896_020720 [Ordospora colligata OC4]KHN70236.1 hypothetical protein M896_020720 [Ordospora colligata OC4]TBU19329.1 hypothetical protein CWI42_020710 [Ordospora colligata]
MRGVLCMALISFFSIVCGKQILKPKANEYNKQANMYNNGTTGSKRVITPDSKLIEHRSAEDESTGDSNESEDESTGDSNESEDESESQYDLQKDSKGNLAITIITPEKTIIHANNEESKEKRHKSKPLSKKSKRVLGRSRKAKKRMRQQAMQYMRLK